MEILTKTDEDGNLVVVGSAVDRLKNYELREMKLRQALTKHESFTDTINSVDECLELIWAIGIDYDGYNKPDNLKSLIDELVALSQRARILLREKGLADV